MKENSYYSGTGNSIYVCSNRVLFDIFLDLGRNAAGKHMTILDQHGYAASVLLGIPPNGFSGISKQDISCWILPQIPLAKLWVQ
jgi:hypothetical protein